MGLVLSQILCDVLVHQGDVVDPVQAMCNTGLVRDHRDEAARAVESGDRFRSPVDEFDAINRAGMAMSTIIVPSRSRRLPGRNGGFRTLWPRSVMRPSPCHLASLAA
jgi:hypothetical protein